MTKIYIKVKGIEYELPKSLNELNIEKGSKLIKLISEEENSYDKIFLYKKSISIILDVNIKDLKDVKEETLLNLYNLIKDIVNKSDSYPIYEVIFIDNVYYRIKDLDKLNTEEYIDIDFILREYNYDSILCATKLCELLYEPIDIKIKSYYTYIKTYLTRVSLFNAYGVLTNVPKGNKVTNIDVYSEFYNNISTGYALAVLNYIIMFKDDVNKSFPIIFNKEEQEEHKPEFGKSKPIGELWGWYHVLNSIAHDNVIERDEWLKKPFREFLTHVSYITQRNNNENK